MYIYDITSFHSESKWTSFSRESTMCEKKTKKKHVSESIEPSCISVWMMYLDIKCNDQLFTWQ